MKTKILPILNLFILVMIIVITSLSVIRTTAQPQQKRMTKNVMQQNAQLIQTDSAVLHQIKIDK